MKKSFLIQVLNKEFELTVFTKYAPDPEKKDSVWGFHVTCWCNTRSFKFIIEGDTLAENPEGNFTEAIALKGLYKYMQLALSANLSIDDFIQEHHLTPYEDVSELVNKYKFAASASTDFSKFGIWGEELTQIVD